jgi:fructose-bisphosphate aldolase, class I
MSTIDRVQSLLGAEADSLLTHRCEGIPRERIRVPAPDHVDKSFAGSDRPPQVMVSLQRLHSTGRLAGTGYLSILPVDQGIEHSGAASFAPNPDYFDPQKIVELAIEGGCNAVACTLGGLGLVARRYAHRIPFILKINHNQLLTLPNGFRQTMFARVEQAWEMGCAAVGATIYFGSDDADREIEEVGEAFAVAHELGLATVLWCYLRNPEFKTAGADHHTAADLTAQANHLGVTLGADLIKQKLPTHNGGYRGFKGFGKTHEKVYGELVAEHPIDWVRWQVANCYLGKIGLINSGGASSGASDLAEAVRTAVVNKRGGGMGLISGRKAFQRPMREGVELLYAIQDVYLCQEIGVA